MLQSQSEYLGVAVGNIVAGIPQQLINYKPPCIEVHVVPGDLLSNVQSPFAGVATVGVFCYSSIEKDLATAIDNSTELAHKVQKLLTQKHEGYNYLTPIFDSPAVQFDSFNAQYCSTLLSFTHPYDLP
jgi:hypothetical protein